jgi:hypothetical protein
MFVIVFEPIVAETAPPGCALGGEPLPTVSIPSSKPAGCVCVIV